MPDDFNKQDTLPGVSEKKTDKDIPVPKEIGPYHIESLMDKGGMSLLYFGTHKVSKEPTIIKVLSPKYLSHAEVVRRFFNEAEIIALADHPNIIKMFGHGEWEGGLYIAMEYVEGISLRNYILRNPLSLKRALELIIDISYALCHLHTHGVIHRDLKPENVLVTEKGVVKVIDFGIAQLLTETEQNKEEQKRLIGTPIYMSPEQRDNPGAVSFPADIYSLGIISYELLLGKLSHGQIHLSQVPKGMQKVLTKALQPKPEDRYQDIVDYITEVSSYLNSTAFEKEKKKGDLISELQEKLEKAQTLLIPDKLPDWPPFQMGLAVLKNVAITGVYLDFLDLPQNAKGIIIAESSATDAEGFIYTAMMRGMVRSLCTLSNEPVELVTVLNDLLFRDTIPHLFNLSYLILKPEEQKLVYISCGYGNLWKLYTHPSEAIKIDNTNVSIGIHVTPSFQQIELPFVPGEKLILSNFAGLLSNPALEPGFTEEQFKTWLEKNAELPPQKLVDLTLTKAKTSGPSFGEGRSVSIVCVSL